MIECIILGDSIAVGTQMFYKECELYGKGGINTWQWNKMYPSLVQDARTAIISLGTNDHYGVNTRKELEIVREKVRAERVFWILPYGNLPAGGVPISKIQEIVREVAALHGDTIVVIDSVQPDRIHPSWAGYKSIVERVKAAP